MCDVVGGVKVWMGCVVGVVVGGVVRGDGVRVIVGRVVVVVVHCVVFAAVCVCDDETHCETVSKWHANTFV